MLRRGSRFPYAPQTPAPAAERRTAARVTCGFSSRAIPTAPSSVSSTVSAGVCAVAVAATARRHSAPRAFLEIRIMIHVVGGDPGRRPLADALGMTAGPGRTFNNVRTLSTVLTHLDSAPDPADRPAPAGALEREAIAAGLDPRWTRETAHDRLGIGAGEFLGVPGRVPGKR